MGRIGARRMHFYGYRDGRPVLVVDVVHVDADALRLDERARHLLVLLGLRLEQGVHQLGLVGSKQIDTNCFSAFLPKIVSNVSIKYNNFFGFELPTFTTLQGAISDKLSLTLILSPSESSLAWPKITFRWMALALASSDMSKGSA